EFIVKDINGLEWGRVLDISEAGLNKLIEVYQNDDIYYVPFTDSIVKSIDAEKRLIIIDPPDGLMDLNKKDSATE
ncbi:MAG: hypothetical protein GY765_23950, partial [bacterium]|nr:hypothetical protein [bacterium]